MVLSYKLDVGMYVQKCNLFTAACGAFGGGGGGVVFNHQWHKSQRLEDQVPLPSTTHTLESFCKLSQQGKGLAGRTVSQQIQGQGCKLLTISRHSV